MTRTESIASLYATMTGKKESDITKSDLDQWLNLDESVALETINASMLAMDGALTYPAGTDSYVKTTFEAVFGYMPDENAEGFAYWVNEIESGAVSRDTLAIALLNGASDADQARAIAKVDAAVGNLSAGQTQYLTANNNGTPDVLAGGTGNDMFIADIIGNTDSAQSGDRIDGGAGEDTLYADMGNSQQFATTLRTTSVENFQVRAQSSDWSDASENNTGNTGAVEVDAERMEGTNRYESNNSRADLVIEDVRIEDDQVTKDITVAMVQTDPGTTDFGVYFDQHSLRSQAPDTSGAGLDVEIMDLTAIAAGNDPLQKNPYNKILFELDGKTVHLKIDDAYIHGTYALLLEGVQKALVQYNVDYPASDTVADLSTVTAAFNGTFTGVNSTDHNTYTGQTITLTNSGDEAFTPLGFVADGVSDPTAEILASLTETDASATTHLITSTIILDDVGRGSMAGDLVVGGLSSAGATSDSRGVEQFDIFVDRNSELQEINSTNYVNDKGIALTTLEEVYIVNKDNNGDDVATGSLTVAGQTNFGGNAIPGTQGNAGFTDVRVLDASKMVGSVNLDAELTNAVTAKYMNSIDVANTAARDDINFNYDLGTNNDTLTLSIDGSNLAAAGTTTREDFTLDVAGNAGDDVITVTMDGGAASLTANGYLNSKENANMTINGNAGNDTITTTVAAIGAGAKGDFVVNAGAGNDTVYANNNGTKGAYVVNANNINLLDLEGQGLMANNGVADTLVATDKLLYKSSVFVTVSGANGTASSGVINAASSVNVVGYESSATIETTNYIGDVSNVNQAIKKAINADDVLSKLYVATDGPENTVIITSLVDGAIADLDLNIRVVDMGATEFAALSATELAGLDTAWETLNANSAIAAVGLADLTTAANNINTNVNGLDTNSDSVAQAGESIVATAGTAAIGSGDNTIDLGTGNDVAVLSTDATSNDTIVFNASFGNDTIVNFVNAAGADQDKLDFTAFLGNKTSASTSVESQVTIATTGDNTGVGAYTITANEVATVNDWTSAVNESWASMDAADVLTALKAATNVAGAKDYGNLAENSFDVANIATLVGNTQKSIIMIENDLNQGEYKVFEMTADNTTNEFTAATLVGTVDFGASVDASIAGTLV